LGIVALAIFLCVEPLLIASEAAARPTSRLRRRPGKLVVRHRAGLSGEALTRILERSGARRARSLARLAATVVDVPERDLPLVERTLRSSGLFKAVERDFVAYAAADPNDTYYAAQWALPKIAAPLSWNLSTGAGVVVGVVDSGAQLDHPDLSGRLLPGYDFLNGDSDPSDDNGHGTRMTGIIVARKDNGQGLAGVAPDALALPVKVLGADGSGPYSDVADGITWAVDQGARVVNVSLVGSAPSSLMESAVNYASANGVVTVASSGNWGTDQPGYPAAFDGAVAVGATTEGDQRPTFSNYGAWLSLSAPGVNIVTTDRFGGYSSSTGTSPAAAVTSGVFALLFAAEPALTREAAIERVESGATDLGSSGWDPYFGHGRLDSYAALVPGQIGSPQPDDVNPSVDIVSPSKGSLVYGMVPVDVASSDNQALQRVELFVDNRLHAIETAPPYSFVVDAAQLSAGRHKLQAYAYDTSGNSGRSGSVKVSFTPGVGLLVKRAKLKPDKAVINATFALPEGSGFDPSQEDVVVTLSHAGGTFFSVSVPAAEMENSGAGRATASVVPDVPAAGNVRLVVKETGAQPLYQLRVKASKLDGMGAMVTQMNLTVEVGSDVLSLSLTLRPKNQTLLVYP
jgi:hypothetical protein